MLNDVATTISVLERVDRWRRRRRRDQIRNVAALALVAGGAAAALVWRLQLAQPTAAPRAHVARAPAAAPVQRAKPKPRPLVFGPPALASHRFSPGLTARSAILVDARAGRVLWWYRPHVSRPVASTTKVLTALVALHRLRADEIVTIAHEATRVPLVKTGLREGERVQAWKLFYGMLLYSGNDDALAVAIASAGSRDRFISLMNEEARALGMRDSHFDSPSGVRDDGNYSSAWDLAALARAALRDPRFATIVRTRVRRMRWSPPTYSKVFVNKNLLLGTYRGATGVKTGYTEKAGHCLVASATRGRTSLIAVVLHSQDPYRDARRLLDLGFSAAR